MDEFTNMKIRCWYCNKETDGLKFHEVNGGFYCSKKCAINALNNQIDDLTNILKDINNEDDW